MHSSPLSLKISACFTYVITGLNSEDIDFVTSILNLGNLPLLTLLVPLLSCPPFSNSLGAQFGVVGLGVKDKNQGLNQDLLLPFGFLFRPEEPHVIRATSFLASEPLLILKHSLKSMRKKEKRASCLSRWGSGSILGMRDSEQDRVFPFLKLRTTFWWVQHCGL